MSKFFSEKFSALTPYTPGEQPKTRKFVKLNTNESPFTPAPKVQERVAEASLNLQLYSDIECTELKKKAAEIYGIKESEILFTNGSDEILNFAFMAFCDEKTPAAFADITYGFYPVFAAINRIPYVTILLREDFSINVEDYIGIGKTIFIANPNAPTGIALPLRDIRRIVEENPDNVVVVDEAYVDFGGESAVNLIHEYKNLLVAQTFSKSRSLAGGRLGYGIACEELIRDLNTIKFSTNPYNVSTLTQAAGLGALESEDYTRRNCEIIRENREYTMTELRKLGFTMTPSKSNFIFAKSNRIDGETLYLKLKEQGVLVRHFSAERIKDYNRITVGTREQMDVLLTEIKKIIGVE